MTGKVTNNRNSATVPMLNMEKVELPYRDAGDMPRSENREIVTFKSNNN